MHTGNALLADPLEQRSAGTECMNCCSPLADFILGDAYEVSMITINYKLAQQLNLDLIFLPFTNTQIIQTISQ